MFYNLLMEIEFNQKVPSINQLKQSPFTAHLSQDPWAPVNNSSQVRQIDAIFEF